MAMSTDDLNWEFFQAQIEAGNAARESAESYLTTSEVGKRTTAGSGSKGNRIKGDTDNPRRGPVGVYPWDTWMDGKEHFVVQGRDYEGATSRFQIILHNTARRHSVYVATRTEMTEQKEQAIRFQFCISPDAAGATKQGWRRARVREWVQEDE